MKQDFSDDGLRFIDLIFNDDSDYKIDYKPREPLHDHQPPQS